jgi:hypothetical protein
MKAGTGKSRPDRHRISLFLLKYRNFGKNSNPGKNREKPAKSVSKSVEEFSRPDCRIPYLRGKLPAGKSRFRP